MWLATEDLGTHQAKRRRLTLEVGDIGIINQNIAAAGFVVGPKLYVPGYHHFYGTINATTPVSTTLDVRIQPGLEMNTLFANVEFTVATIVTIAAAGPNRYCFYWGTARAPMLDALGSGSNYVISSVFRFIVRNVGAAVANIVSIGQLECV